MRPRVGIVICLAIVGLAAFTAYEPRLHNQFPSLIDDWSAIASAPAQLHEIVRLKNPEGLRYRPGFVVWNSLQWHTLGAPTRLVGPQMWGLARLLVLVFGVTLLAALLVTRCGRELPRTPRWLLTLGVPLAVLTVPSTAVDIARFGPQEPLMVGCMSLGAVILVRSLDQLLDGVQLTPPLVGTIGGLIVWTFGVLQKESSICILLVAPFLLPTVRDQAARWGRLGKQHRKAIVIAGVGMLLPLALMLIRSLQLATAEERAYEELASGKSLLARLADQLTRADETLGTPVFGLAACAALVLILIAIRRHGVDWLVVGLLTSALAFVMFAAESGVVASRYYLPAITLVALAFARAAGSLGARVALVAAGALVATGSSRGEARDNVARWTMWKWPRKCWFGSRPPDKREGALST